MLGDSGGEVAVSCYVSRLTVSLHAVVAALRGYLLRLCGAYSVQPERLTVNRQLALYILLKYVLVMGYIQLMAATLGKPTASRSSFYIPKYSSRLYRSNNSQYIFHSNSFRSLSQLHLFFIVEPPLYVPIASGGLDQWYHTNFCKSS